MSECHENDKYVNKKYESTNLCDIEKVLKGIQDNNSQNIKARDVRNAVYTLWEKIEDLESNQSSNDVSYIRENETPNKVGGVPKGATFSGSVQKALDRLFYPNIAPVASISGGETREFGNETEIKINWKVIKKSSDIASINLNGSNYNELPDMSGSFKQVIEHSENPGKKETKTFSIKVTDDKGDSDTDTTTVTWMNSVYYNTIDLSEIGNPNLDPEFADQSKVNGVSNFCTDDKINTGNKKFTTSYKGTYELDGEGTKYLIFAWPSNLGNNPIFNVGGFDSTAFTKLRTDNPSFTNSSGYTTDYVFWITNNTYGKTVVKIK